MVLAVLFPNASRGAVRRFESPRVLGFWVFLIPVVASATGSQSGEVRPVVSSRLSKMIFVKLSSNLFPLLLGLEDGCGLFRAIEMSAAVRFSKLLREAGIL